MDIRKNSKAVVAVLFALGAAMPLRVLAQDVPSYAESPPSYADAEENIHGRIVSFNGAYDLRVKDDRGYIDDVELHQGTIINPNGITLEPGMVVSVLGYNSGSYLAANEIDTPYTFYGGIPYWDNHPWDFYGPSESLAFFFGSPYWWHGDELREGYFYDRGVRVYPRIRADHFYADHSGEFHGRDGFAHGDGGGFARGGRDGFAHDGGGNGFVRGTGGGFSHDGGGGFTHGSGDGGGFAHGGGGGGFARGGGGDGGGFSHGAGGGGFAHGGGGGGFGHGGGGGGHGH